MAFHQTTGTNNSTSTQMDIRLVVLPADVVNIPDEVYEQCLQQIDTVGQSRVRRYYRREDSWRSLVGMLLPRCVLVDLGVPLRNVTFAKTEAGKPYADCLSGFEAFGYNVSHDNHLVAIVSQQGSLPDVRKVGIDVMKRALPRNETYRSFLLAIGDTLTPGEVALFKPGIDPGTAERYIFQLWTLKEAYTKALGLGLGFDFKRIEFDIPTLRVLVDGQPPKGWEFVLFEILDGEDIYQGTAVRWVGGEETHITTIPDVAGDDRFRVFKLKDITNNVSYNTV